VPSLDIFFRTVSKLPDGKLPYTSWDIEPSYWEPIYSRIAAELGLSKEKDAEATRILHDILAPHSDRIQRLAALVRSLIRQRVVAIFGCGPSLDESVDAAKAHLTLFEPTTIAADGATSALLEAGLVPDIITTDLDGCMPDIVSAANRGSVVLLHGHADNIAAVQRYARAMRNVIPITQVEPTLLVRNFGGFTDGDKSIHLAGLMGAARVVLFGMDFGSEVGPRSDPSGEKNFFWKLTKLKIGAELAASAINYFHLDAYSAAPLGIPGVKRMDAQQMQRILRG